MTQIQIGERITKTRSAITELARVGTLPSPIKKLLKEIQIYGYSKNWFKYNSPDGIVSESSLQQNSLDDPKSSPQGTFEDHDKSEIPSKSSARGTFETSN